mmetsp:Transcript_3134/g.7692  ORF Transcript_3134/g.7692 Transcript_3134/m.7692 type:complete len:195 (+) Transcript_3134:186-770(+)
MVNVCQDLGVDMGPAQVAKGVFVVPLYSWYNYLWDEADPNPGGLRYDSFCRWPMDDLDVWQYMLKLNHGRVQYPYKKDPDAVVLSLSHFLPRAELPYPWGVAEMAKAVGCKELDLQVQRIGSDVHVFGHTHKNTDTLCGNRYDALPGGKGVAMGKEKNETRYVQSALEGGGGLYKIFGQGVLHGQAVDNEGKPL